MEQDPNLTTIRKDPRFQALLSEMTQLTLSTIDKATKVATSEVTDGVAVVDEANTVWDPNTNTLISAFSFPAKPWSFQVRGGDDGISRRLNLMYGRRQAAGNFGDLYDNRDSGHSALPRAAYPQLSHVKYSPKAIAAGLHYGVNQHLLFNAITIGNSSTALTTGLNWRSQARIIQTTPSLMARAWLHYANDHLYVFPEHNDHDPGKGDVFPANTPYMLVSQGSSRSDQPILHTLAAILAAFDPGVKDFLRAKHLVMPTVQMIFRSGQKSLKSSAEYLTGKAHPSVFDTSNIDLLTMILNANALRKEEIPPRVDLKVIGESLPTPGINYSGPSAGDEVLFNTPSAIARVVRSTDIEKRLLISAKATVDPNGHALKFEWRVLRGDADRIKIIQHSADGSEVELRVRWQQPQPLVYTPKLVSSRVDIAVFAYNGYNYSAPAFVSLAYPTRQQRRYDDAGRILEVDYNPEATRKLYEDPVLFVTRTWRDRYLYTNTGDLMGWERISDKATQRYTYDGARVTAMDALDRPVTAERVRYVIKAEKSGRRSIIAMPTGELLSYSYRDQADLVGRSRLVNR